MAGTSGTGGAPTQGGVTSPDPEGSAHHDSPDPEGSPHQESAGPTTTAAPEAESEGSVFTPVPTKSVTTAKPVDQDTQVAAGPGLAITLRSFDRVDSPAFGPGDLAGPAVRVTLRALNDSGSEQSLEALRVSVLLPPDSVPAPPIETASRALPARLKPGGKASGTYLFSVPAGIAGELLVVVDPGVGDVQQIRAIY